MSNNNLLLLTTQDVTLTLWEGEGVDTPVNDATASADIIDLADGLSVLGEGETIALEYSNLADGVYKGAVPSDADVVAGQKYKLVVTAVGTDWQTTIELELLSSAYKGG